MYTSFLWIVVRCISLLYALAFIAGAILLGIGATTSGILHLSRLKRIAVSACFAVLGAIFGYCGVVFPVPALIGIPAVIVAVLLLLRFSCEEEPPDAV